MALVFPPQDLLVRSGSPDQQSYLAVGLEFLEILKDLGQLQASSRVLDLGCGTGRIGQLVIPYLDSPDQYWGQDVDFQSLAWLKSTYPKIEITGSSAVSPGCPDKWATLVLAASVYTHLDSDQVLKSLTNLVPKLAPGAVVLATFFILPQDAKTMMTGLGGDFQFIRGTGGMRRARLDPNNIAYTEEWISDTFRNLGFEIRHLPGWWLGHKVQGNTFQDLIVARKV